MLLGNFSAVETAFSSEIALEIGKRLPPFDDRRRTLAFVHFGAPAIMLTTEWHTHDGHTAWCCTSADGQALMCGRRVAV